MTARQCERCGEALHPCEDVILVLGASLEDFEKGRMTTFEVVAVYHGACYDEIAIREIDPDDEDALREACDFCGHPIEIECGECLKRRVWGLRA